MAVLILMLSTGVLAALGAWWALHILQREHRRYRAAFQEHAAHGLADFFLFIDPSQLWGVNLLIAGAMACLAVLLVGSVPFGIGVAFIAFVLPRMLLAWARRRRLRRIDEQLPDLLLALAGALRAGTGLQAGLAQVARHAVGPLAQELGLLLQQQRMGLTFNEALDAMQSRIATESIGLVVAAIKVAGHTGGSLAETLERISLTLRTRLQLLGRIQALTSQGRMQAWIMAALPVALALVLYTIDPEAMSGLWRTPVGWSVLLVVLGLETLGVFLVRRIVSIEV